jgi:hypothetical protein
VIVAPVLQLPGCKSPRIGGDTLRFQRLPTTLDIIIVTGGFLGTEKPRELMSSGLRL